MEDLTKMHDILKDVLGNYVNNNDVYIVLIICLVVAIVACFASYLYYLAYKRTHPEITPPIDKEPEVKKEEAPEYKERKDFIKFCYEMARSTDESNKDIKVECWTILKATYVDDKNKIIDNTQDSNATTTTQANKQIENLA